MILFDGTTCAREIEMSLTAEVAELQQKGKRIKIGVIAFQEDETGLLYSRLKMEAAGRVGIGFQIIRCSFNDDISLILQSILALNQDPTITGVMIQKPARKVWESVSSEAHSSAVQIDSDPFAMWWGALVSLIDPTKDVDGLHPLLLDSLRRGTWNARTQVLPATAQAVISILEEAEKQIVTFSLYSSQVAVIGRSDIVGQPLYYYLKSLGVAADLLGRSQLRDLETANSYLHAYNVVISATGIQHLVTGKMVQKGAILIDVGEPKADIDAVSVAKKAAFLTPVPGGVGPVTIMCLLQNVINLVQGFISTG